MFLMPGNFTSKIILRELFNSVLFDCPMSVTTKIKNRALKAGVFNARLGNFSK
jgi:hypothetical protein